MNDIQEKENIYSAITSAVQTHQTNIAVADTDLILAQNEYMKSVVYAALAAEKLRRKKDQLFDIIIWGVIALLAVIVTLINYIAGIVFVVLVLVLAFLLYRRNSEAAQANYFKRKTFFQRYSAAIPASEQLKWDSAIISNGSFSNAVDSGWICPYCTAQNPHNTNFCINCGSKRY